jgi:hypothetical protein
MTQDGAERRLPLLQQPTPSAPNQEISLRSLQESLAEESCVSAKCIVFKTKKVRQGRTFLNLTGEFEDNLGNDSGANKGTDKGQAGDYDDAPTQLLEVIQVFARGDTGISQYRGA